MRLRRFGLILLATAAAVPALAQPVPIERRVGKLEQEMRAVQRKVFPGGNVEPEIRPQSPVEEPGGVPASSAVSDLTARVDSLEAQLARLTGQIEENGFKLRQLEAHVARLRAEAAERAAQPEPAPAPAEEPAPAPADEPAQPPAATAAAADPAEDAYLTGFRLWEQKRYGDAQAVLEPIARKWPKHRRASWAQNLLGRAYLDDGKPATAAKMFLANYQANPKGERAADSLYFLGQALVALKKPVEACKVYDELQDVYPAMRDWVKQRLPKARADAKCDA